MEWFARGTLLTPVIVFFDKIYYNLPRLLESLLMIIDYDKSTALMEVSLILG